jgi:preprotein translocase subunit SecG
LITLVTIIHVVVCIFLILVILLQAGKGGGMGAAFGGAGAQTVFGGRGAQTILGKVTSISAGIFMLTSLTLAYQASRTASEVEREARVPAPFEAPAGAPAAPAPGGAAPAPGPEAPAPGGPALPGSPSSR